MNLVVCFKESPVEPYLIRQLQDVWPEVEIINVGQSELPETLLEADYFCGHAKVPVDWDSIVAQGRLKWIQSSAAGLDWCLVPSVVNSDIAISTASGVLANQVAEHTLSLILSFKRRLPVFFRDQFGPENPDATSDWAKTHYRKFKRRPTDDLTGSTVGIVGFGGVGRRIGQLLAPWKCRILAVDPYPIKKPDHIRELWPGERLDELLAVSDIVVLSLPLNDSTRGMFDYNRLKSMKNGALLANMARGPLLDTNALFDLVQSGHLGGAVIDVSDPEPLPPDHPLWSLPNVLITPHVAGQSHKRFDEVVKISCENIKRWNAKLPLINFLSRNGKKLGFPIPNETVPLWWEYGQYGGFNNGKIKQNYRIPKEILDGGQGENYAETEEDEANLTATTTFIEGSITRTQGGRPGARCSEELLDNYLQVIRNQPLEWEENLSLLRILGSGGQGVVYLSERLGSDDFVLPVALKIFSPEYFEDDRMYDETMCDIARVSAKVSRIQHDNLLDVHCWKSKNRIRMMEMEWVDGFDLGRLLQRDMLQYIEQRVSQKRWNYINEVIITEGTKHPRLKPGIAIAIIRDCLGALAALHREGIVHGDIKPSNIMLKRTGNAKIVDIGSAFEFDNPPAKRTCTPSFAAPEVLDGGEVTPQSDLASLGYVLIEMLSGDSPFEDRRNIRELLEAKRFLGQKLHTILPREVASSELLMNFCRGLIAPDPNRRFPSAEEADLMKEGAANFHRQLIKGDLASEYENEIRLWLGELESFV